jgi:ribonuclease HI
VGLGWIIISDDQGAGPAIDQGSKTLKGKQVAFDAEITAIEEVLKWFQGSELQHLVVHSDSTSAIARAGHSGADPGQQSARAIRAIFHTLEQEGRTVEIQWVKGHAGIPGNERADLLAGKAAEKTAVRSPYVSLAYFKLQVSERFLAAKDKWHKDPDHHGSDEIPRRQPRNRARNSIARTAAPATRGQRCT